MAGPLEGIVVLDLTRVLAGPFCTMLLADMGAEIIKVERPGTGDDSRSFGPFMGGESAYFMSINRGKKSITLNLKAKEGKDILRQLANRSDVLVENFKPGVMNKLGLSWEKLHELNPRLIYASSSGFGQYGPYSSRPAYDLIIQGMGGMMSITGPDKDTPTKVGSSIADIIAGIFTCVGVLAALHKREKTGQGQQVDVAMLDCMVSILENAISRYVASGTNPLPIGNRHPSIAPFASFKTADGLVNVACGNDDLWRKFCIVLGLDSLAQNELLVTNEQRVANWAYLEPLLAQEMVKKNSREWLDDLERVGVPGGPINGVEEVMLDPHVISRDMVVEMMHPLAGLVKIPGFPIKFSEDRICPTTPAPTLGQHNNDVLQDLLGLQNDQIQSLIDQGVI